jgi:hypothetical protein
VTAAPAGSLLAFLEQVPDPRGAQGRRFSKAAMLAATVCAVLCGARGYAAIAQWIRTQPREVWWLLGFYRRPPCAGAFRDLLMALSANDLEQALSRWMVEAVGVPAAELEAVAMDGKTLCSTMAGHGRSLQLISLLDQRTGCVLSQAAVPEATNEHKASLELLRTLVLGGRIITADAAYCQRDVCRQIVDSGGHYLVVVKDNQPDLHAACAAEFRAGFSPLRAASA